LDWCAPIWVDIVEIFGVLELEDRLRLVYAGLTIDLYVIRYYYVKSHGVGKKR